MNSDTGKWIMLAGAGIVLIGIIIYFFHDKLHWIGRLPGDIRVEKENFRFYFPITTMILASLLLTLIINIIKKLLQ
jgi:O-antigen/teichoic acid export membrane protein